MKHLAILPAFLLLAGCGGFVHDETLVGPYRLVAIDVYEDMAICWSEPGTNRNGCVGDGLPGPTVFAAGFDAKYLVAATHPKTALSKLDKTNTAYYYVVRSPDEDLRIPYAGIKGPFTESGYRVEKARLHLPEFTRVFDDLK